MSWRRRCVPFAPPRFSVVVWWQPPPSSRAGCRAYTSRPTVSVRVQPRRSNSNLNLVFSVNNLPQDYVLECFLEHWGNGTLSNGPYRMLSKDPLSNTFWPLIELDPYRMWPLIKLGPYRMWPLIELGLYRILYGPYRIYQSSSNSLLPTVHTVVY